MIVKVLTPNPSPALTRGRGEYMSRCLLVCPPSNGYNL